MAEHNARDNHDTPATSAIQDSWVELTANIREGLHKYAARHLLNLNPHGLHSFAQAVQAFQWAERNAGNYDALAAAEAREHG